MFTPPHSKPRQLVTALGVPIACVGVVALLKISLAALIGSGSPSLLFLAAIIVSAWYGGLLSGLLATLLSCVAMLALFPFPAEVGALPAQRLVQLGLFCIEGLFISILGAARYHVVDRLHLREQQQAAVAELSQQALSNSDISALMEAAVALVSRLMPVQLCNIIKLMPDGQLLLYAGVGCDEAAIGKLIIDNDSHAAYTLQSREPVIFDDLSTETRFKSSLLQEHGIKSGIGVIIHTSGDVANQKPFGILGAHSTRAVRFTDDDLRFLETVSDVLGAALERRRAEDALAQSETQNRIFLAAIPDLMVRLDRHGTILELLSQQSWDITLSSERFAGQSISSLVPREIAQPALECIARALETDTVQVFEYELPIDDKPHFFEARIVASSTDEVLAIIRNISEQKEAEHERDQLLVREREARGHAEAAAERIARLQRASNALAGVLTPIQVADVAVAEAMAALDAQAGNLTVLLPDGKTLEILAATGYAPAAIEAWKQFALETRAPASEVVRTGKPILVSTLAEFERDYPEIAAVKTTPFQAMASIPLLVEERAIGSLNLSFAQERVFASSDDAFMQVLARQCARALDHARVYEAESVARSQAEEAQHRLGFLADASAQLASSLDYRVTLAKVTSLAVPDLADWCAVYVADEEGVAQQVAISHVDPAKIEWVQEINRRYPPNPDEINGAVKVIRSGKPELYTEVTEADLEQAAHDEEHLKLLHEVGFHSAMIVPLLVRGRAVGALSFVATKESKRRYNENDMVLAEDLARRVASAIDNAQLYQQAQEANRIKDDFLATLSHELRTPLNAILGWIHLLQNGQLDKTTAEHALGSIERSAKSQAQLINDLLDVSRIISGKLSLEHGPVELKSLVREAAEIMLPVAEAKSVKLTTTVNIESDVVTGDATRLQQVVWNLISNAIKFTPENGEVEVRLEQEDDTARITVRDTGAGIAPEFLPHVFDRFRQADSTTTRRHGGLGLGLSIVRHLVDMHGGTIIAESAGLGQGATFRVELPLARIADDLIESALNGKNATADDAGTQKREPAPLLAGLKVLVVDDEIDTREMLTMLLSQHGAEIRTAESATAALDAIDDWTPDALISDIGMPDADGYMLLARVRSLDEDHQNPIPAVAVTAYASEDDRVRAMSAGFQMYLTKPIQPAELAGAVARLAKAAAMNSL